jgi:hypothetical protein
VLWNRSQFSRADDDFGLLCRARLRYLVPVREPLVLISQIQRSGGTLLSQLFDDHPQVHAHPHELKIGYPKESTWPRIDLKASAVAWFEMLEEPPARKAFKRGYEKYSRGLLHDLAPEDVESFPFLLAPSLQWRIFEHCVTTKPVERRRDVLDAYMTSYFNAWLDNQNLYTGPKKIITGFTPRLVRKSRSVDAFFAAYPDGRLLTIIRDPKSWFASARKHKPRAYRDIDRAVEAWARSALSAIDSKGRYGDRVYMISFDELVDDTRTVMERLSAYLGIAFQPTLLEPTFNGFPIKATSAFPVSDYGIVRDPLARGRTLSNEESSFIERRTRELYERALASKG